LVAPVLICALFIAFNSGIRIPIIDLEAAHE
jgi:hypothetical protein